MKKRFTKTPAKTKREFGEKTPELFHYEA